MAGVYKTKFDERKYIMKVCSLCGKSIGRLYPGGTCQGCYNYFRQGGTVNPIPNRGEITLDERGFVICHICGRAYKRLGSHIKESHNLTIAEYKEVFGLCNNAKTTEHSYSMKMRENAYRNEMPKRLEQAGMNTRIKCGEKTLRLGKKSRLQECLDRHNRYLKSV